MDEEVYQQGKSANEFGKMTTDVNKFGGDPDHIVLNGVSAGATSIVIMMASPAVKGRNLFKGVIVESAAAGQLKTPEQSQVQLDCLAKEARCSNSTEKSPLECLRKANTTALLTRTCQYVSHCITLKPCC